MPIQRFPIEASHIKMFAASIADENPIYHDEEKARATEPGPTHIRAGERAI